MIVVERCVLDVTPSQAVDQIERNLGLSCDELASALKASPRTVQRWRRQNAYPQHDMCRRLNELMALDRRLRDTFESVDAARAWLHAPSRYLGELTPADALRVGRIDRVDAALEALDSGVFL